LENLPGPYIIIVPFFPLLPPPIINSIHKTELCAELQRMGYIKNVSLVVKLNLKRKSWPLMLWKCRFLLWKDI